MTKKILIIGSNGYLGTRLVEFLIFRTDYHITTISQYYSPFNLFKSARLVSFECDQAHFPISCIKQYDVIISLAPKNEKLISYIQSHQTFIFTDPRYQYYLNNIGPFSFSHYHLDLINVNGFSSHFDLSKPINYNVYLYKNDKISELPSHTTENYLGIFDFCRCIESLIIFGKLSRSGSYRLCSNLPNQLPFDFTYQDTYNTIVREIVDNWDFIKEIKNPISCLICKYPSITIKWNREYVYCTNCFHISKKHIQYDRQNESAQNSHQLATNENVENFDSEMVVSEFIRRYPLCETTFVMSQNILVITETILQKKWQIELDKILRSLSDNQNLCITYTTFEKLSSVHSLFDFVFIPDGIQTLENPFTVFKLLGNKLFDNGKIILKTTSTIPFLLPVDLSNWLVPKVVSFYNIYSLKLLIERHNLYINKSNYMENGENIICMISKKNSCISECVNDCFLYELERGVYLETSY